MVGGIGSVLREFQVETRPDFGDLAADVNAIVEVRRIPRPTPYPKND